ncbi:MAG: hypothetical protein A2X02_02795 [Bacteroidetes bacterium GWF2_29_10]|nr:MAG: hypothetical protein A2X02_02795 [Bacteroidetes bacterium GWF2_29_10]
MRLLKLKVLLVLLNIISIFVFSQNTINLEDLWLKHLYRPSYIDELRSMNNDEYFTSLQEGSINMFEYKSNKKVKTIVTEKELSEIIGKKINIDEYSFNGDESLLLIATETESIYRHSTQSEYYIYELKNQKVHKLSNGDKIRLTCFAPLGNQVAYVKANNIYIEDYNSKLVKQITSDGEINKIINGLPDWVYEEEFSFAKGFEWSADAKQIAYYKFNETNVNEFVISMYKNEVYPELYKYKYPKSGEDNSVVTINIYDLESTKTIKCDIGKETDVYIPRIRWNYNNQLLIFRLNRLQNQLDILFADNKTGTSDVVYTENNKYYIDINDNIYFYKDKRGFLITSEKSGYNHLYLIKDKNNIKQLTTGEWDVIDINGVDEKNNNIYFTSTADGCVNKTLYCLNTKEGKTLKISAENGSNNPDFSSNFKYYINTYSSANTPPTFKIYETKPNKVICTIEDNKQLVDKIKTSNFSNKEFFDIKLPNYVLLKGWIIKPKDFDPQKKYPVLIHTYGGPGVQRVLNERANYDYVWHQMLAQQGYIVVVADNRGTPGRGEEFKKCTYLNLGKYDVEDQIAVANYLKTLPYIDANRIGIQGWSYGGYMSLMCLSRAPETYKMAISVAPVSDWRFYDNIYTERFMRRPIDNEKGYKESSVLEYLKDIKGKLLLVHGSADDNVHLQNSIEVISKLVNSNIQFDMFIYPDKNHGIYGGVTRYHLYKKMTDFIKNNL